MFKPRPRQAEVLTYQRGRMGVAAVPGSGKTATLSYLAARLVALADLREDQEVLIVTLVNSAVGNFSQAMARVLREEFKLLPGLNYRVCTLHSLANDILRERPELAGLDEKFRVLDSSETNDVLDDAVKLWVKTHPNAPDTYLSQEHYSRGDIRRDRWPELVRTTADAFIRQAKDLQLSASAVRARLQGQEATLPLAAMCADIYELYERGLSARVAVDFQDLIRLALRSLQSDAGFLARLRDRWPYILEDEAQDSSKLQEEILRLLVGESGNWVRVGDPNQAIFETFTTANPKYLRDFLKERGVTARSLPNSGRSTQSIIDLANALIRWSLEHPNAALRQRQPLTEPLIEPTPPGDPQGNPPDDPQAIRLIPQNFTASDERDAVARSLQKWLPDHPDQTVAILLPSNHSGADMVKLLRSREIPYVENLRTTTGTRAVVGSLIRLLAYLQEPASPAHLAEAYRVWRRDERGDADAEQRITSIVNALKALETVEDFLWPRLTDWLEQTVSPADDANLYEHLAEFRMLVRRWQGAVDLPIDQLVLTLAADIFHLESELATAYSAALHLRRLADDDPGARLPEFIEELNGIASGRRAFQGLDEDAESFDPNKHPGVVAVTTMHKAKGLEWDRVYLMSVSNYDYPSADPFDTYIGEKWYIRDRLDLQAEALGQLDDLAGLTLYVEGEPSARARLDYAAERLRLLYVGITRAKRDLIVTWNTGQRGEQVEARPLAALRGAWEKMREDTP